MVIKKKNNRYSNELTSEKINNLLQIEEIIARSHEGIIVDEHAPLEKKTNDKELLARLLEIERVIIERARLKGFVGKD